MKHSKAAVLVLLLLLALATQTEAYSLLGNWTLQSSRTLSLGGQTITLQITDYVFKGLQIQQKLSFRGCQEMQLQSSFAENQLFINPNSYFTQPLPGLTCTPQASLLFDTLNALMASVFYFAIDLDTLMFNDHAGNTVLSFKYLPPTAPPNLVGVWSLNQYANTRTALSVQITDSQIALCQGMSVYNYTLVPAQNLIKLTPVAVTCPSTDLTKALETSRFFRFKNGILDLYDQNVSLSVELVYTSSYDPNRPLFGSAPPPPPQPTIPLSASNLVATWNITSLFSISMAKSPYYLIFGEKTLTINGGCDIYSYDYTLNTTSQIITVGAVTSGGKPCSQSDDGLFTSGITKMNKYLLSNNGSTYSLKFYDQNGSPGYYLSTVQRAGAAAAPIPVPAARPAAIPTPQTPPAAVSSPPAPTNPLAPGTYLMLLLQRRDLARAIVTIANNSFTYKICDSITQSFTQGSPTASSGSIKVTTAPPSSASCSKSNDQLYSSALAQATSYVYDPNAAVTTFSSGSTETVLFSRAS